MIIFIRIYLYWSILWGFLAIKVVGLQQIIPLILAGIDLIAMIFCVIYILLNCHIVKFKTIRMNIYLGSFAMFSILLWSTLMTTIWSGNYINSVFYVAALFRPVIILMALVVYIYSSHSINKNYLIRLIRIDLLILMIIQLLISSIQYVNPFIGEFLIIELSDRQSSSRAFAEGDVSGLFPNTIDLAYFLIACYAGLSINNFLKRRPPNIFLTLSLSFFIYITGSSAALLCFALISIFLNSINLSKLLKYIIFIISLFLVISILVLQADFIISAFHDKIDDMMLSRLGLIMVSIPNIAANVPLTFLTGRGSDFQIVLDLIASMPEVPLIFTGVDESNAINDVFWIALVLAFGAPLTFLYLYLFGKIFIKYLNGNISSSANNSFSYMIILVVLTAGFFNQILLVRSFVVTIMVALLPLAIHSFDKNKLKKPNRLYTI
jgi:hypothetical protein